MGFLRRKRLTSPSYLDNPYYQTFAPYLSRLFTKWTVREYAVGVYAEQLYFVIDGDFCSLCITRDLDITESGYFDEVSFGSKGHGHPSYFVSVHALQDPDSKKQNQDTLEETLEWMIQNREQLRLATEPRNFLDRVTGSR